MDEYLQFDWQTFFDTVGTNPFAAMWFFFSRGGWAVFVAFFIWAFVMGFKEYKQNIFGSKKSWVVLSVHVPRLHEQTPRAVENMFAYIGGAHSANNFVEEWYVGRTQDTVTFEIVSIDGHVQFIIRTTRGLRNLVEAGIYSQYPDADIVEVEDYAKKVPHSFPDEEWSLWGTQFTAARKDFYPIKTYPFFEDKVSGEFKDPLAAMLESMSRLGPGEQAWYQIVLTPIAQGDFHKKSELLVKKLTGQKVEAKKSMLEKVVEFPLTAMGTVAQEILGSGEAKPAKKETNPLLSKMLHMTTTEKDIVTAIENKASQIVFSCKMRFIYVSKKEVMSLSHIAQGFMGAMRQFSMANMQTLKPDFKHVGISNALWWFKQRRNDHRRTHLMHAYANRSNWAGLPAYHLSAEELATLWHFPITMQSKPPQLKKTESKRTEPPANIPFG